MPCTHTGAHFSVRHTEQIMRYIRHCSHKTNCRAPMFAWCARLCSKSARNLICAVFILMC